MALAVEWEPWNFGIHSWTNCPNIFAGGPGVPTLLWIQFATKSSLGSPDELNSSITIVKLHGLLLEMVELRPWPSWELISCIVAVIICLFGTSHIMARSVFTLKDIYSRPTHYLEVHNLYAIFVKLLALAVLHAGKLYWLQRTTL
jgi:hypothetical protein